MKHQLKICGMLHPENIAGVASLQPDYLGFIFFKGSKRYAAGLLPEVVQALPASIKRTGVFVNEDLETVLALVLKYGLNAVQLHGPESADYCKTLSDRFSQQESAKETGVALKVIKAFGIDETFDFHQLEAYKGAVDYFLFDTQTPDHGGSGKTFSWALLEKYTLDIPYFLSGGIGLESVNALKEIKDPRLLAIDVNSRFELEPGLKNINQLKEFIHQLS